MEKASKIIGIYGSRIVSILSGILAAILVVYSGYAIYDSFYVQKAAFSSWDLSKYRPVLKEGKLTFEELLEINPDTVGWLVIEDTNIDYPVVQGKDDLEYANKDVFGKSSLTGSIYLTSINTRDFTNSYNLIYGHHMANGAMFGDIEKFQDYSFFYGHQNGILITTIGVYDIHIFARIAADCYDSKIYSAGDKKSEDFPAFLEYIQSLSVQWDPTTDIYDITERVRTYLLAREQNIAENGTFTWEKMPRDAIENGLQLLAMSTCADAVTNGRQLLFGTLKLRTEPLPEAVMNADEAEVGVKLIDIRGHANREYWSLVDLLCVIMTVLIVLPLTATKAKYSRLRLMKHLNNDENNRNINRFRLKIYIGLALEIALALSAVLLFIANESFHNRMTVVDNVSPLFLAIFAVCGAVDVFLFRYRERNRENAVE